MERGFRVNIGVLAENISSNAIIARRLVKDHLLSNNLSPHSVEITPAMRLALKSAHQKYVLRLEEEKKKQRNDAIDKQKSIINGVSNEIQSKVSLIRKAVKMLESDFLACVEEAEKKSDLSFITKANALKRKSLEKTGEIETLEKTLQVLKEKCQKIQ